MIEQLKGLPENSVGFRSTGKVTKDDYERVMIPAIEKLAANTGKINCLFVLDTDISNVTVGAWYDDLKVGLSHFSKWHKIAVVSDQDGVNKFTSIAGHAMPGEVKTFRISELTAAKKWVSE